MEFVLVIPIIYLFLLVGLAMEAQSMKYLDLEPDLNAEQIGFTIIINFRNESQNLPGLLSSIAQLEYDFEKTQFIFVNDGSTDDSVAIIRELISKHSNIEGEVLTRKPKSASAKKDGITQAIPYARFEHIVTTDADCLLPKKWLRCYNAHFRKYPKTHFLAAPVFIPTYKSLIKNLQSQEMVALQVITMGAFQIKRPFMCNGANMAFTARAFNEVNGYSGNEHVSSGDDIFLLEKLWQLDSEHCHYLKNANVTVTTFSKESWKDMITQRARWAQKGSETSSLLNKAISFQILVMSLLFIANPFLLIYNSVSLELFLGVTLLKVITDLIVLFIGKQFFDHKNWLRYFGIQFFIYPFIVIMIAMKSLTKTEWRGRKVNQPTT